MRRNLYLPSSPTCTHPGAPPCTYRAVHCVRSVNDFSTLRRQTWVGIECRPLRAQEDSVSTDRQHQRFASPFRPSQQLDQKRYQNVPETGVSSRNILFFFPKRGRQKQALSTPFHLPPFAARLSTSPPATVTQSMVCISHTQCAFLSLGLIVLNNSLAMAETNKKSSCRIADD